jgi:hypothetical protein
MAGGALDPQQRPLDEGVDRAGCRIAGGEWYSAYDNFCISSPGGLDIDHLVPLAEAWGRTSAA